MMLRFRSQQLQQPQGCTRVDALKGSSGVIRKSPQGTAAKPVPSDKLSKSPLHLQKAREVVGRGCGMRLALDQFQLG